MKADSFSQLAVPLNLLLVKEDDMGLLQGK